VKNKRKDTYRKQGEVIKAVNFAPHKKLISILYIGNIGVYEDRLLVDCDILKRSRFALVSRVQNADSHCHQGLP
jgi:hypothetical protein